MVKRAKSPEIPETDKYFTVYKPFPSNADFEVQDDYIACARWIAAVVGPNPLHGMWWKPSARGMIILEIDKQYTHNERILGEHRWDEFLKKPTPDEKGKVSQIFHSFYARGREAQKDGWKRIHVESSWFENWHPTISMRLPYPETHWCPVPKEDQTNKSLCRPLPVKDKAPPPKAAPPVVGSSAWAQAKSKSPPTKRALRGAWEQRKNEAQAQVAGAGPENRSAWNKPIVQSAKPTDSSSTPNAWVKPPLATPAINSASGGLMNKKPHASWGSDYPAPPGLVKSAGNASSSTANTSSSGSGLSGSGSGGSGGTTDWTSMDDELPEIEGLQAQFKSISMSQSQQALWDGADSYDDNMIPDEHEVLQPWEREDEDGPMAGGVYIASPLAPDVSNAIDGVYDEKVLGANAWSQPGRGNEYEGAWAEEPSSREPLPASLAPCPHHPGRNCKKGICQWRAEQEKKEAREKREQEKRERERQKRMEKKEAKRGTQEGGSEDGNWRGGGDEQASVAGESTSGDGDPDGFSTVTRGRGRGGRGRGRGRGKA